MFAIAIAITIAISLSNIEEFCPSESTYRDYAHESMLDTEIVNASSMFDTLKN